MMYAFHLCTYIAQNFFYWLLQRVISLKCFGFFGCTVPGYPGGLLAVLVGVPFFFFFFNYYFFIFLFLFFLFIIIIFYFFYFFFEMFIRMDRSVL